MSFEAVGGQPAGLLSPSMSFEMVLAVSPQGQPARLLNLNMSFEAAWRACRASEPQYEPHHHRVLPAHSEPEYELGSGAGGQPAGLLSLTEVAQGQSARLLRFSISFEVARASDEL